MMPTNEWARQIQYEQWETGAKIPWIDQVWELIDRNESLFPYRDYKVHHQPIKFGDWVLDIVDIPKRNYERLWHVINGPQIDLDRDTGFGPTTVLKKNGKTWMSDTRAEIIEHMPWTNKCWWMSSFEPRVLINGLGIGVAVEIALRNNASHVDVVEIDEDIIRVVGRTWEKNPRVTIHHGDAFDFKFPKGISWHLAWHDIWPTISEENIPEMDRLRNRFKNRVGWQGFWQREGCLKLRKYSKEFQKALENQDWETVKRLDSSF